MKCSISVSYTHLDVYKRQMLSYPSDEVGNHLVDLDMLDDKGVNPWTDVLTEQDFRNLFGYNKHPFTGVDYIDYYKSLIEEYGVECEVIFSNNPKTILNYTKSVLTCDIHTRFRTKKILKANGGEKIYSLDNILCESIDGSGYNESFGLDVYKRQTLAVWIIKYNISSFVN